MKLEFSYDYAGRRIYKKVYNGETLTSHIRFVYDGYKLVEELNALNNNAVLRRYTWSPVGLDTPVSVYDAAANATYYYHTDANKNITELTSASGAVVAHYEYSPFGKVLVANGAYAATNPFRFSSEFHDDETSLVYYNYRYYSPELGRWLSRDPIEEAGGVNLYEFIFNKSVNYADFIGLSSSEDNCMYLHFYYNSKTAWIWAARKSNNHISHVAVSSSGKFRGKPIGFNPTHMWSGILGMGFGGKIEYESRTDEVIRYKCCCLSEEEISNLDLFLDTNLTKPETFTYWEETTVFLLFFYYHHVSKGVV